MNVPKLHEVTNKMRLVPFCVARARRGLIALTYLWSTLACGAFAQEIRGVRINSLDSMTVVPGPRYQKGWLHQLMTGRGYRELWAEPLRVKVANMAILGGGLRPLRIGGGMTTKTLHLVGSDGKRYVFRSVDKDPSQGIPEIRGTPLQSILQDQISAFHPTGALVVPSLLKAAGVLHVEPRLIVVPDDQRLGEFRDQFAGKLVWFEERPDKNAGEATGFAGSAMVASTERLLELLDGDPQHGIDTLEFLKARLVDLYVGDRDRTGNNWRWAQFESRKDFIWRPIPRDRDQAFIRLNGVLKWFLRFYEPRLVAFGEDYSGIVGLTRSAWDLDRRLLVGVEKSTWDSIAAWLQSQFTDLVIGDAVKHLPPEHYRLNGPALARKLRKRRDQLHEAAGRFYEIVSEFADIHATNKPELAVIDGLDNDHVEVRLYRRDHAGAGSRRVLYFRRTFNRRETQEIRLYLYGGNDQAIVRGGVPRSAKVRVIGGDGDDELIDSTGVRGQHVYFYDSGERTRFVLGPKTAAVRLNPPRPVSWRNVALTPDWGHTWRPKPELRFDGGYGLYIAAGATRYGYGFLKKPYNSRIQLSAGYAAGANRFVVDYRHEIRDVVRYVHSSFLARWSGIEILHFHGFGNETEASGSRTFYKVNQKQILLAASATFASGGAPQFSLSPVLKVSSTDTAAAEQSFLSMTRPYGSGKFSQLGAKATFRIDTRDRSVVATRGVFLRGGASYYPAVLDVDRGAFGEIHGEISAYLSPSKSVNQTLALRVGGKKVWGTAPFHEAAFVGGAGTLRGFREQRFAGSASAYANVELRVFVNMVGLFGLTDVGRVFQEGESSRKWHVGMGGGILIAPLKRTNTFSIGVARGADQTSFYIGTGFLL